MAWNSAPVKNLTFAKKLTEILTTRSTIREVKRLLMYNGIYADHRQIRQWADGMISPAEWFAIIPILACYFNEPIYSFVGEIDKRGICVTDADKAKKAGYPMEQDSSLLSPR